MKFSSKSLSINTIILRNPYSKYILNITIKTRKNIILEESLSNATTIIIVKSFHFLIPKNILQRYNSSPYIRNIRIPLTIDEISYFFLNNFILIWLLTFRRRDLNNISIPFPRLLLTLFLLFMLFLVPLS
jgi:hypothetical protein